MSSKNRKSPVYGNLKQAARVMYEQGASRALVAHTLRISPSTAAEWARQLGFGDMAPTIFPPRGLKKQPSAVAQQFRQLELRAIELFRQGKSTREISELLSTPISTVATWKSRNFPSVTRKIVRRYSSSPPSQHLLGLILESAFGTTNTLRSNRDESGPTKAMSPEAAKAQAGESTTKSIGFSPTGAGSDTQFDDFYRCARPQEFERFNVGTCVQDEQVTEAHRMRAVIETENRELRILLGEAQLRIDLLEAQSGRCALIREC